MFLASAYENFIGWQNGIINLIIENSKRNGILNSYSAKLNEEISIQDATENDIINIDDNTYSYLEELIMNCSMRNIFTKNGKIDYKNYYDNIYKTEDKEGFLNVEYKIRFKLLWNIKQRNFKFWTKD